MYATACSMKLLEIHHKFCLFCVCRSFVCSELDELLRERRLAYIVRLLRELLWPDGHWPEEPVEEKRTDEQRRANKAEALQKLIEFLPGWCLLLYYVVCCGTSLQHASDLYHSCKGGPLQRRTWLANTIIKISLWWSRPLAY